MLVLSRNLNESIVINDNVVVTGLSVKGDHVRLGIERTRGNPRSSPGSVREDAERGVSDECRVGKPDQFPCSR